MMEEFREGPNMEKSTKALGPVIEGILSINKRIDEATKDIKFDSTYPKNFDSPALKEVYESGVEYLKSTEFKIDMDVSESNLSDKYLSELANLGLEVISLPRENKGAEYRSLQIINPDKFIKYLSFLESSNLKEKDIDDLGYVLHGEILTLLKFSSFQDDESDYYDSVDSFLKNLPKIIDKIGSLEQKSSKYDKKRKLESSLYVFKRMQGANEKGYFPEFTDFFHKRTMLLGETQNFLYHRPDFLNTFQEYVFKQENYFEEYFGNMMNVLNDALTEYKNNKKYATIFEYLYNFLSSLLVSLTKRMPENLQGKIRDFHFQLASIKGAFDQIKH